MNKTNFLLILGLVLFSCGNHSTYKNRVVSDVQLKEMNHFEYDDGNIVRMTADDSGIYISSSPDNTIRAFDYSGKLCKTLGKKGEAPWENGTIWSYGKDSVCYWLHDYNKMALKKYDVNVDAMLLYRRFMTKHNVMFLKNNQFLIPHFKSETGICYVSLYDALKDSILKSADICKLSGKFKKLPPFGDFTFQGDFCKNSIGQAVFYCMYNSSFFFIDKNFNVTYHTDIRNLAIGEPTMSENSIRLDPDNIGILSGTMDNRYIYFLAPKYQVKKFKDLKNYLIDVYDISTKKYIKSFTLPSCKGDYAISIAKTNKGFVVSYNNGYVFVYDKSFID